MSFIGGLMKRVLTVARPPRARGRGQPLTGPQPVSSDASTIEEKLAQFFQDHGRTATGNAEFSKSPSGSYETYERMAENPTLKLGLVKLSAPIKINPWGWEKADDDVPQQWIDWAKKTFDPLRDAGLNIAFDAWTYGWSAAEVVRTADWDIAEFKPLSPRSTQWLATPDGELVGLRNVDANGKEVDLPLENCFVYVHEKMRGGCYGRSIFESARASGVWWNYVQICEKNGRYICKIAGVIWAIYYPTGTSRNAVGVEYPNEWLARRIQQDLSAGGNIRIPNKYASMVSPGDNATQTAASIEKALKVAGLSDWKVECYHPEGADFTEGFIRDMQYHDELLVRSLGLPDRAVLPSQRGQAGSHNDSTMHDNTADMISQLKYSDICHQFRQQVVDPASAAKFGEGARNRIICAAPPLSVENSDTIIKMLTAIASNPDAGPELFAVMDVDAALDDVHFPVIAAARGTFAKRALDLANRRKQVQSQVVDPDRTAHNEGGGNGRIKQLEKKE